MVNLENWTVLIVDDEVDAQDVLIPVLKHHNISVSTALSGEEAIDILESTKPTLALIDLSLPGLDGWQVLKAMRASPQLCDIPAIAMTAFHSNKVATEAIKAGFIAYFPKPINARTFIDELVSIVA